MVRLSAIYRLAQKSLEISRTVSYKDVQKFAELSGDVNPIHCSGETSIVHGTLLLGFVSGVIGTNLNGALLIGLEAKFINPCVVGTTVRVRVDLPEDKLRKITLCSFRVFREGSEDFVFTEGKAKIKI